MKFEVAKGFIRYLCGAMAFTALGGAPTWVAAQSVHAEPAPVITSPTTPTPPATPPVFSAEPRFKESIEAFAQEDLEHAPKTGGVVFVGSSTIRMWKTLDEQFKSKLPVIVQRGFGGSRMSDCAYFLSNLVTPYKPHLVVLYAGDNDLNEGATPQQVFKSFTDFVSGVRKSLPNTRIAFVSIKPSPSRMHIIPAIIETNAMVKNYVKSTPNMDYVDVFTAMMAPDGEPRNELFGPDALHMNDAGYALWKNILDPHIQ